ncbi:MAG TPA: CHAT domain-containing protein [Thermoanaerobaculia bacterium]
MLRRPARRIASELRGHVRGARQGQAALLLLAGQPDRAIATLEQALAEKPGDPGVLSDLAAAFLVRGSAQDQPLDLIAALDCAERAVARSPASPEALFNRALARQRLHLSGQASRAWDEYLERDSESDWAKEARTALAALTNRAEKDLWPEARSRLESAAQQEDGGAVASLVGRFRQEARTLAEEQLLIAWANQERSGRRDQARATLASARSIGRALRETSGEAMLADSIAAIDQALTGEPQRRADLIAGLHAYAEGLRWVTARSFARAEAPLDRAQRLLEKVRCPLAAWARFLLLRCAYQRSDFAEVQWRAQELLERWSGSRYHALVGRTLWVLGTTRMAQGRPAEALDLYRLALVRFEGAGERGHLAAVHTLLASAYQEIGDTGPAWRHRHLALRELASRNEPARLRIALTETAMAAAESGYLDAALVLQTEALDLAGEPLQTATALLNRAVLLVRTGATAKALEELRAARAQASRIEDVNVRESVIADLLLLQGRALVTGRPRDAANSLSEALTLYSRSGRHLLASRALQERAHAYASAGKPDEAEADLWDAMERIEEERGSLPATEHRLAFFNRWGSVYDEMVALQVERGRTEQALNVLERSRARTLLDWSLALPAPAGTELSALSTPVRPDPVRELQRQLPPGLVVVCYQVLPEKLLIWVVDQGSIRLRESRIAAARLEKQVRRLWHGSAKDAEQLYDAVIRPVAGDLASGRRIVFVPEEPLDQVPFGALRDARSGRLLVEQWPFAIAPSLNALVRLSARSAGTELADTEVLVVADPAFDQSLFPGLPRLSAAGEESRAVAAAYPRVRVLRGGEATRRALLDGIGRYGIVHFAGHGILSAGSPLLSQLALAPDGGDSGVLYARELLGRPAGATRLVVLSACQSAGSNPQGEGVAGLVWPLLSRGVPRVVASLRRVDDAAAARLSAALHRRIAAGEEPAAALRNAQLECLSGRADAPREVLRCTMLQLYGAAPAAPTFR